MSRLRVLIPPSVCFAVLMLTGPLRSYSFALDIWISFPLHVGVVLLLYSRLRLPPLRSMWLYLLTGIFLVCVPDQLYELLQGGDIDPASIYWPCTVPLVFAPPLAYAAYVAPRRWKAVGITAAAAVYLLNLFWFSPLWDSYVNFGVTSSHISQPLPEGWQASPLVGASVDAASLRTGVTLIDFWSSGCPACVRSFPEVDRLYRQSLAEGRIRVQTIFISREQDPPGYVERIVREKRVGFPVAVGALGLDTVFRILVYPTSLVVHEGRIVYRGRLEDAYEAALTAASRRQQRP